MTPFDRFQWLQGWVDDLSLSTTAKACLAALLRFMNAEGVAWPSLETIAERAGCSVRSARTHLTTAEGAKWISRSVKPGHSVVYQAIEPRQITTQPRHLLPHTPANNDTTPAPLAAEATTTTTTTSSTTQEEVEEVVFQKFTRENFQPENEPDSLDAFLMHVANRHGFLDISPAQAMGTSSFLVSVFGTSDAAKTYASARFVEKDGAGLSLQTMIRILHQDAAGWKKRAEESQAHPNHGGQAPVQTSRLEVRNTEWSSLPETQAWFDTANHEKI